MKKIKVRKRILENTKDPMLDGKTEEQGLRLMRKEGSPLMSMKRFRSIVKMMQEEP